MLTAPQVGKTITVVVRNDGYKPVFVPLWNDYTFEAPKTKTYTGTVMKRDYWMRTDEFNLSTGDKHFPVRQLAMKNVISINGAAADKVKGDDIKVVNVAGSKGASYEVVVRNGVGETCSCKGFQFRHQCRHLAEASAG